MIRIIIIIKVITISTRFKYSSNKSNYLIMILINV